MSVKKNNFQRHSYLYSLIVYIHRGSSTKSFWFFCFVFFFSWEKKTFIHIKEDKHLHQRTKPLRQEKEDLQSTLHPQR